MEDDDHGRKSHRRSCDGRYCEQARRLMRVSSIRPSNSTFNHEGADDPTRDDFWPITASSKKTNYDKSKKKDSGESHTSKKHGVPCESQTVEKLKDDEPCDEYMLQYLHRLKRMIRRALNYAWCYTQYCYPGLRTVAYYKKVKRACQEREKAKKTEKKDQKNKKKLDQQKIDNKESRPAVPVYLSAASAVSDKLLADSSTQTLDEGGLSVLGESDEDDDAYSNNLPEAKHLKHLARPLKFLPAIEEELGWGQRLLNHLQNVSQAIVHSMNDAGQNYPVGTILKVVCVLLAPAVMWLGANYMFLKRKYKSLSGKLKRVKEENGVLKRECNKLGSILSSTEKLKMPFSTKGSRQQVATEFTRLAESRMKSENEINRLSTEKAALLEELKMAKKQRDLARNQYSSITQGILETDVQT